VSQNNDDDQLHAAAGIATAFRAGTMIKGVIIIIAIGLLCLMILSFIIGAGANSANQASGAACTEPGDPGEPLPDPGGTILQQQIANAKTIAKVVSDLGLPGQATLIALTAAAGESDLINLNHGDSAGPDSRGLFQQRSGWGTEAQRMNPTYATQSFLLGPKHDGKDHGPGGRGLVAITGWQLLQTSAVISKVQINADPNHYTQYVPRAEQIAKKAGIDLDDPGNPTASAYPTAGDTNTAIDPGDCDGNGNNIGPINPGSCPLDEKHAKGKPNPNTCGQAVAFVQKQMDDGSHAWSRACLALVTQAYGWHGGRATARQAAQDVINAGMMSKDTTNIPTGAVMWWDGSATGNDAGHVAIYIGHGYILSNDVPVTDGRVGRVPWTYPVKSWGQKWLGWSPPYFPAAT
jgi:hypothetical protein